MIKKILLLALVLIISGNAFAFEDCIVMSKGRLTDIRIEDNTVIDVYPLITIMNKKNTLIVHPLKTGKTCFTIKRNDKEEFLFHVVVEENKTLVSQTEGFEILSIDAPPEKEVLYLDLPPAIKVKEKDGDIK